MDLSIIVVGYNNKDAVHACLSSLIDQDTGHEFEIFYVDNASQDGSAEFVQQNFSQVETKSLLKNHGYGQAVQMTLPHTTGDYLLVLNQDIELHKSCIETLLTTANSDSRFDFFLPNQIPPFDPQYTSIDAPASTFETTYFFELTKGGFAKLIDKPRKDAVTNGIFETNFVSGAAFMLGRDTLNQLTYLFDSDFFQYGEDIDLTLRAQQAGHRVGIVTDAIITHEIGSSLYEAPNTSPNLFQKVLNIQKNRFIAYKKNLSPSAWRRQIPNLLLYAPLKARYSRQNWYTQLAYGFALSLLAVPAMTQAALTNTTQAIPV